MNKEQFAAMLNGREYGNEITTIESKLARESGLLVIFGYSDDGVELRGMIDDELSAINGCTFRILDNKIVQEIDRDDIETLEKYGLLEIVRERQRTAHKIEAKWDEGDYPWIIETALPHATFDILEDGEKFCRGVVIDLAVATHDPKGEPR